MPPDVSNLTKQNVTAGDIEGNLYNAEDKKNIYVLSCDSDRSSFSTTPPLKEDKKTNWVSIYLLALICVLNGIQLSVFFASLYPYINLVDPSAGVTFFGFINCAYSLGQGISAPLFGLWMNKSKSVRMPLTTGLVLTIFSNLIYCFVEDFYETNRRYVMLVCRFFVGAGGGTVSVMRAFASTASIDADRPRAVSIIQASYMFGMTVGPGVQSALAPFGYPGYSLGSWLSIDMYTAPAWLATLSNIVSLVLLWLLLTEDYVGLAEGADDEEPDLFTALPVFDKIATAVCLATQFAIYFIITNMETVGSMYSMAMFGWTEQEATVNNGILQAVTGISSLLTCVAYAWKLGDFVSRHNMERVATMAGIFLMMLYYIITYPWPFFGQVITYWNTTDQNGDAVVVGCNPARFPWCGQTHQVNLWVWAGMDFVALSVGLPLINVSMNTLFSRILGGRRQGTMQGIQMFCGSIARILGPLFVSILFAQCGPELTWGLQIGFLAAGLLLWAVCFRRMVPLKVTPKMGEFVRLPRNAVKYRF